MTSIKIFFLLFSVQLFSQNLVQNPSFEDTAFCADIIGYFDKNPNHWSTPTRGTTDIFSECAKEKVGVPNNFNGMQEAKSGKNYAGFYLHSEQNYREYIQAQLSEKLEKDVTYKVSFYVSLAEKSDYAIKSIDFLLSAKNLNTGISRELSEKQLKKLKIENYSRYKIDNTKFYNNTASWQLISMEFKAKGTEQFLTIGNFNKNSKTEKLLVSTKNKFNISYYYIDLVRLERSDLPKIETKQKRQVVVAQIVKEEIDTIELNKEYVFSNVVFDFNSTELSKDAKTEIETINEFLKKNTNTKILISGHTDSIGTPVYNQELSENRAKSVADFFIFLGLDTSRISSFGYGNTNPISSNATDEGRNKNRRVSFKIMQK